MRPRERELAARLAATFDECQIAREAYEVLKSIYDGNPTEENRQAMEEAEYEMIVLDDEIREARNEYDNYVLERR